MRTPNVLVICGVALLAAVELVADRATKQQFDASLKLGPTLAKYSLDEGLICRPLPQANAMAFSPPLIVTTEDCDEIIERFGRALARLTDELVASGEWSAAD